VIEPVQRRWPEVRDTVSETEFRRVAAMSPTTPTPGKAVRGSATGRPLMAALDLLGRRWALRIMWELRSGPLRALDLQERCDQMSSSVLYQRLKELSEASLVEQSPGGAFQLTNLGRDLVTAIGPLDTWAKQWATKIRRRKSR
jgi:DNA-binding HxlR family transcriptional regulator